MTDTKRTGFDNEKYLREQTAAILERVDRFNNKLYLEFGGKLLYNFHAARVLPDQRLLILQSRSQYLNRAAP